MGLADGSRHHNVHRMLWDGSNDDWRPHLEADAERAGMERRDRGPILAVRGPDWGPKCPLLSPQRLRDLGGREGAVIETGVDTAYAPLARDHQPPPPPVLRKMIPL